MEQYVSKSALIAEIKRRINSTGDTNQWLCGKLETYREIHDFINTLEVKEVQENPYVMGKAGRYSTTTK